MANTAKSLGRFFANIEFGIVPEASSSAEPREGLLGRMMDWMIQISAFNVIYNTGQQLGGMMDFFSKQKPSAEYHDSETMSTTRRWLQK